MIMPEASPREPEIDNPSAPRDRQAENAEKLRIDGLSLAVAQAGQRQVLSPICAAVVCVGLWQVSEPALLMTWVGLLVLISVWRQLFARAFQRASKADRRLKHWEHHFFISLLAAASAWGVGAWQLMPEQSPAHQALIYTFAVGMVGGSSILYGVHRPSAVFALPVLLLPSTIYLIWLGDPFHWVLAAGGLMLLFAANFGSKLMYESMRRTIELTAELDHQARIDALSTLPNRRSFIEYGEYCLAAGEPYALIMIDVDRFKSINDRFGHAAGDRTIRTIGELLRAHVTDRACAARIGGEEFAILLPQTRAVEAGILAQALLGEVRMLRVGFADQQWQFTVSMGIAATKPGPRVGIEALLARADKALYLAKSRGRDQVAEHTSREPNERGSVTNLRRSN